MTETQTVDEWLKGYERRDKKCIYIGGAVAALLVVGGLADKLFGSVNPHYRAWFITMALVSGVLIGICKIVYEQASTELSRKKDRCDVSGSDNLAKDAPTLSYPRLGPVLFIGGLLSLAVTALILICAVFAAVNHPNEPDKCVLEWNMKTQKISCVQAD